MTMDPKKTFIVNEEPAQIDVVKAIDVDIQIDNTGKKLWVNIDGVCALRVQRIEKLTVVDNRPEGGDIVGGNRDQYTIY